MYRSSGSIIDFPQEYKEFLVDMTHRYICDRPQDPVDFAIEYLTCKKLERVSYVYGPVENQERTASMIKRRKNSVLGCSTFTEETYRYYCPEIFHKTDEQMKRLEASIVRGLGFQRLDSFSRKAVMDAMRPKNVKKGEIVIKQGTLGEHFYVVEHGIFAAYSEDGKEQNQLKTFDNCGSFGEHSLLFGSPRLCSVIAKTDGQLWELDRTTFRRIMAKCDVQKTEMLQMLLSETPLFKVLSADEKLRLIDALAITWYPNDVSIMVEGEKATGMYLVISGELRVTKRVFHRKSSGSRKSGVWKEVEVNRLFTGDYFGELALITDRPRAATVYTVTPSNLAFLCVEDFERLLGRCVDLLRRNADLYTGRSPDLNQLPFFT